jgi:outer membrane protein assembly factor BamB
MCASLLMWIDLAMRYCGRLVSIVLALFAIAGVVCPIANAATPRARNVGPFDPQWRQFRFDQNHSGYNRFEHILDVSNVPSLGLGWQAELGRLVFSSSPAVVDGVVYIASSDGRLWAYPATGCGSSFCDTPLWQSVSLAQIMDSPTVADGIVYVGSQTSFDSNDGLLSAFDAHGCGAAVCAPLWQGTAGKESILDSSPAVGNGFVYVGAFDGRLYAFAARGCGAPRCAPVWTGKTGGTIESSPTIGSGVVYIGSDDGRLYAFAAGGCGRHECAPLWTGDLGSPAFSSTPALANGVVYIGAAHALSAFAATGCGAATCAPLWQAIDEIEFFGGSPAVANGRIYIGFETGLAAYDAAGCGAPTCGPLWLLFGVGFQAAVESSPTIANGVVYAGRNTGEVLAWSAEPCGSFVCDNIWSATVPEEIVNSSPTVFNGRLYIGSADNQFPEDQQGRLYVFELP